MIRDFYINNKKFQSRLIIGTGKYKNLNDAKDSIHASGTDMITVSIRRAYTFNSRITYNLLQNINWDKYWILPNTAGCKTVDEVIRTAKISKELVKTIGQSYNNFIKLELIPDTKYLLPDPIGTIKAAECLIKMGFTVLPYINADPILAKHLEDIGCSTVMPLGSLIGSGQGIRNTENIRIIIENAKIPVIIDAGIGAPSEAAQAMEMGADAVLINTAIADAKEPRLMAQAMKLSVIAGYKAYCAKTIKPRYKAVSSSPINGKMQ